MLQEMLSHLPSSPELSLLCDYFFTVSQISFFFFLTCPLTAMVRGITSDADGRTGGPPPTLLF